MCYVHEPAVVTKIFADLVNSGLPFQKPPYENIREKPIFSDTQLAKNQNGLLPIGNILICAVCHPVFLSLKKDVAPITEDRLVPAPCVVELWTPDRLFHLTPIQRILQGEKNRSLFWNAEMSGRGFLSDGYVRHFWSRRFGLPNGVSSDLAELAQMIKNVVKVGAQEYGQEEIAR